MEKKIQVTNLLLASLLQSGGAQVECIKTKTRYSVVELDLTHFSTELLADKIARLERVLRRMEDPEELKQLFSNTVMGETEDKYIRLKRRVVKERSIV